MIECPDEDSFGLWLAALRALLAEREPPSAIGPAALLGSFGCELDQVALATRTPTLALTLDPSTGFIPKTSLNPEPELEPEPVPEPEPDRSPSPSPDPAQVALADASLSDGLLIPAVLEALWLALQQAREGACARAS